MDTDVDQIPTVEIYRGVGLHDQQSPARLVIVRQAIDGVFAMADSRKLLEVAKDPVWPPEARLFAAAKLEAMMQIAADERKVRPAIDLDYVRATVAGVDSVTWRHPRLYCSLLDHGRTEFAAKREIPLERGRPPRR